jgi:16S rRNA (cytosine1402-N4)-methyltransferase
VTLQKQKLFARRLKREGKSSRLAKPCKNKNKKSMPKQKQTLTHIPVLLNETLQYLSPERGQSYLDVTAGFGGHAKAVLDLTQNFKNSVLVDRDNEAIDALEEAFAKTDVKIVCNDFLSASDELKKQGKQFDMILADLGVSSLHLDEPERGFSFTNPGPLDMRMDSRQELSADTIINTFSEPKVASILAEFGQEPKAHQIARNIICNRPIKTTDQLARIVAKSWPGHSRVHPATRTFQGLRIAVNSELTQLSEALPTWLKLLTPGGRLVIISFHSLEDRIVKNFLSENAANTYDAELELLTKKPVQATHDEIVSNPRARSAKLRASRKK